MADEKPVSWSEWKAKTGRWVYLLSIDWACRWIVHRSRSSGIVGILILAGELTIAGALFTWLTERGDREKERHYRAWNLINGAALNGRGDGGRQEALQDLHDDGVNLVRAPLEGAYLSNVDLRDANLFEANFRSALLNAGNLSGANLRLSDLSKANLRRVNLARADLSGADMTDAVFGWCDLSGVKFRAIVPFGAKFGRGKALKANLTRASLVGSTLDRTSLTEAILCGTVMPNGEISNRDCLQGK